MSGSFEVHGESSTISESQSSHPFNVWEHRNRTPTRSPRRGKGRSTVKFDSLRNTNWVPVPRIVQPSTKKYRSQGRRPQEYVPKYESLAQFKMAPCVLAENKPRPFMGSCCNECFPISRASAIDKRVFSLSVYNVLYIPFFQRFDSSFITNIFKKNQRYLYSSIHLKIIENERITKSIEKDFKVHIEDKNESITNSFVDFHQSQLLRAEEISASLKTSISTICYQISTLLLRGILKRIFDGILIHKGQMEVLKVANQEDVPIIYLPLYQSPLDYLLVPFILHLNALKLPLVLIDNDIYIPFIRFIMRYLGAVFLKKKLKWNGKEDNLYSAIYEDYLLQCLKSGHNFEAFIDNTSNNSHLKLLKVAMESISCENLDDVYVSVVSINYEKKLGGNYIDEQLGPQKHIGNMFTKIYSFWKLMHFNFGNIRFNFGQPFSLKELLQNSEKKVSNKLPSVITPSSSSDESQVEMMPMNRKCMRLILEDLRKHINYDAVSSISFMSTQLVAFLFLTQYRKGATQQQLQSSLDWLRGELLSKKRDVGFTGESALVIHRAVQLLGKQLVVRETVDMEWTSSDLENNNVKVTIYKPIVNLPYVLELQHYSNFVLPVFLLDSMIANALYSLVDVEICHFRHCDSKLFVQRNEVIDKAIELSEILQFEFTVIPPCADRILSFGDTLDELIQKECLHILSNSVATENVRYNRKPHHLSFESDDDEEEITMQKQQQLKIDLTEESINHLEFLRNVLSPLVESYWLAACTLLKLVDDIKEENVFIQEMQITAQDKLYKGLLAYEESFSAGTFKNALKLFKKWQIVEEHFQDGIKIVCLNDSYNCNESLNDIIAKIEEFRK